MYGVEAHGGDFIRAVRHGPLTTRLDYAAVISLKAFRQFAIGQVRQVVNDVFRYGLTVAICRHCFS